MESEERNKKRSSEKLRKQLLSYNIMAVMAAIFAVTSVVLYFRDREENFEFLFVALAISPIITWIASKAGKIKKEIRSRSE